MKLKLVSHFVSRNLPLRMRILVPDNYEFWRCDTWEQWHILCNLEFSWARCRNFFFYNVISIFDTGLQNGSLVLNILTIRQTHISIDCWNGLHWTPASSDFHFGCYCSAIDCTYSYPRYLDEPSCRNSPLEYNGTIINNKLSLLIEQGFHFINLKNGASNLPF